MRNALYIILIGAVVLNIVSCGMYTQVKKETIYGEFEYQGFKRSYLVHLPVNYTPEKKYPLIFVMHGIASRAKAIAGFSGFTEQSDLKDFIVCYPQGYKWSWGITLLIGPAPKKGIDDYGFFDRLIDSLDTDYSIDLENVYACGISNGGFMSALLACNLSERFAGIALVCSNMFEPVEELYQVGKPMPILIIAGTKDPLLDYAGGKMKLKNKYSSIGYEATVEYWVAKNGCCYPSDSTIIETHPKDKTTVIKYYCKDETNKNEVVFYKVIGGGHAWPGRGKDFKSAFFGDISHEIDAAEVISDFFMKQVKSKR